METNVSLSKSFLFKFLKDPKKIGSVIPSTSYLAKSMTKNINWQSANVIIELGAGTGIMTETIFQEAKQDAKVIVAEQDPELYSMLQIKYPNFIHIKNAEDINYILQEKNIKSDYIICSLPFSAWPKSVIKEYLAKIADCLTESGELIMFQYSPYIYSYLLKHFSKIRVSYTLMNIPPAIIYRCSK